MDDVTATVSALDRAIRAVGVPIEGVSIGTLLDRASWRVDFSLTATGAHRTLAATVLAAFVAPDVNDETAQQQTQHKDLKAVALGLWECIPNPLMTKLQLQARIVAIYKTLP